MRKRDNQKHSDLPWDTLLVHVHTATMAEGAEYGMVPDGAIGIKAGKIVWVGPTESLLDEPERLSANVVDCGYIWATPGLIDCRTHFLGMRPACEEPSLGRGVKWLLAMMQHGITTVARVPVKTSEDETRIMEVVHELEKRYPVRLCNVSPGMQAVPRADATKDEIKAMARAGKVAMLSPFAFYFGTVTQLPPVALLREHKVPMALYSNAKPLDAPFCSPLVMQNMGCMFYGLTPEEVLRGMTANAARALGIWDETGTLAVGRAADIALWDILHPAELSYHLGYNPCLGVFRNGVLHRAKE